MTRKDLELIASTLAGAQALSVWSISAGPRMIEVAAANAEEAVRIALDYLNLGSLRADPVGLRVTKIDRCVIVKVA